MLQVAAASGLEDAYETARRHVNARGGAPRSLQSSPPWVAGTTETMDEWADDLAVDPIWVPPSAGFRRFATRQGGSRADPVDLALELVLGDRPEGNLVDWLHAP